MVISHNMLALNANRQFNIINKNKAKSTEKLSSGYRINRAADDAAGLSISEKMRRQIRGLSQGVKNTEDGVSLCQVADGALAEVSEMLHRITELSVQSANGTNTDEDRKAIQQEISQIQQEIERIGETTEFNERKIFGGGEPSKKYKPLTVSPINITGTTTDTSAKTYNITANDSGFTIDGNTYSWSNFYSGNNTLSDNPITAGNYSFDYHGFTISLSVDNNANKQDLIGRMNGASFSTQNSGVVYKQKAKAGEVYTSTVQKENISVSSVPPTNGKYTLSVDFNNQIWLTDDNGNVCSGYNLSVLPVKNNYYAGNKELLQITNGGHGLTGPFSYIEFLEDTSGDEYIDMIDGATLYFDTNTVRYNNSIGKYIITANRLELSPAKVYSSTPTLSSIKQTSYKGIELPISQQDKDTAPLNLWIQSGSEAGQGMFLEVDRMNTTILGINDLDVSTVGGANHALDAVKGALEKVSSSRSKIGAQQNRLEHTIANELNVVENTTSAESRIRDTDMSKEMVAFSKDMILENVGQAMLAQANQSNQGVLSLLQ